MFLSHEAFITILGHHNSYSSNFDFMPSFFFVFDYIGDWGFEIGIIVTVLYNILGLQFVIISLSIL